MNQSQTESTPASPSLNRRSTDPGNPNHRAQLPAPLLTLPQACKLLVVSKATLYRMVERRQITFIKIGGSLRFHVADLAAWLDSQRRHVLGWQVSPLTAKIESTRATGGL